MMNTLYPSLNVFGIILKNGFLKSWNQNTGTRHNIHVHSPPYKTCSYSRYVRKINLQIAIYYWTHSSVLHSCRMVQSAV